MKTDPSQIDPDSSIEALVCACLVRMDAEGPEALEAFCAEHPDAAETVRRRIAMLQETGLLHDATQPDSFPERLGDFKLLERLGAGGMGIVYRAVQESLGREVALKLVRPEQMWFGGARERFRREVEATARLQHPGIVPVYTVGEESGVPFFAMELVHGASLADVLARLRGRRFADLTGADFLAAVPGEGSSPIFDGAWWECAARIAREVAEALDHAHRRGVHHRDLKPSNVMVTRTGRVLLVDFGLASRAGADRLTRTGSQMGSMPYVPPEQIERDSSVLDARSDVYGVGITLYELLVGAPPWRSDSTPVIVARIAEGRPPPPRRANASIPPDLETVCLTAMERDPDRRYASAADLARDLSNVLERRPIEARAAGPLRRLARFTQRRPAHATAAALAVALVVGAPTALWLQQRAANEEIRGALEQVRGQRDRAERNLDLAGRSIERLLVRVGDPELSNQPGVDALRQMLLEDALALNSELARVEPLEEGSQERAALARDRLCNIELLLGRFDAALEHADASIAAWKKAPAGHAVLPLAYTMRARALRGLLRNDEALAAVNQAAEACREPLDPSDPAEVAAWRDARVHIESFRAELLFYLGRTDEGIERQRALVDAQRAVWEADGGDTVRSELANMATTLGGQLASVGRFGEALPALQEAVAHGEACLAADPLAPNARNGCAAAHQSLGGVLAILTRPEEAVTELRRALELCEGLTRDYPTSLPYLEGLNKARLSLGGVLGGMPGKEGLAQAVLRDAVASLERLCAADPADTKMRSSLARALGPLAESLESSDPGASISTYERAIAALVPMIEREAGNPEWKVLTSEWGARVALLQAKRGDVRASVATLTTATAATPRDPNRLRIMSGRWSRLSKWADQAKSLEAEERTRLHDECVRRGLETLRKAIETGFDDLAQMRASSDLAALRASEGWADIEKLCSERAARSQ